MNDDLNGGMNIKQSLLFFGIPGLLMFLGFSWLVTPLAAQGVPLIWAYFLALWSPVIILFILVLTIVIPRALFFTGTVFTFTTGNLLPLTW
jgi:hypothetical protein